MMDKVTTLQDLAPKHIEAMRKISIGTQLSPAAVWNYLFDLDLVEFETAPPEDDVIGYDVLTPLGKQLLAEAEAAATPPTGAPAAGEGKLPSTKYELSLVLINEALEKINQLEADNARLADYSAQQAGSIAIVMSWLRGVAGDMHDLSAQDLYDMLAKEHGFPPAVAAPAEQARLADELARARAALEETCDWVKVLLEMADSSTLEPSQWNTVSNAAVSRVMSNVKHFATLARQRLDAALSHPEPQS